jgi:hypothetical protein
VEQLEVEDFARGLVVVEEGEVGGFEVVEGEAMGVGCVEGEDDFVDGDAQCVDGRGVDRWFARVRDAGLAREGGRSAGTVAWLDSPQYRTAEAGVG